jgi:hypothetical protein
MEGYIYEVINPMIFNYSYTYKRKDQFSGNQPVAVIANFAVDGRFKPVYFQYVAEDSTEYTFKVDGVRYTKDKPDRIGFCCLFTNEGTQHQVMLTFYFQECIWKLEV